MPCAPDYIAAALIVSLGSVIGARCAIKPKRRDDWIVTPNLFGGIVGDPSSKKSPALGTVTRFLDRLEAKEAESLEQAQKVYAAELAAYEAHQAAIKASMKKAATGKGDGDKMALAIADMQAIEEPEEPHQRRFKSNDSTVEKLGDLLVDNPQGLLVFRDELIGLLASWEKDGREGDRAFYLEGWNGNATPRRMATGKQIVRKSFLHASWSAMNLASELSGDDALKRIQDRAAAYWTRQAQRRLIASLNGILADNVANDSGDMVEDISTATGTAANFSAAAVIDTAATLGDAMRDLTAIGMHSATYKAALKADMIQTLPDSQGGFIQTFRGLGILVDDGLPVATGVYTTVLFGPGAVGYGLAAPRIAAGTEVENLPSAGNGGGQQVLHSRVNLAIHPA